MPPWPAESPRHAGNPSGELGILGREHLAFGRFESGVAWGQAKDCLVAATASFPIFANTLSRRATNSSAGKSVWRQGTSSPKHSGSPQASAGRITRARLMMPPE
jgi:hypothetical protein